MLNNLEWFSHLKDPSTTRIIIINKSNKILKSMTKSKIYTILSPDIKMDKRMGDSHLLLVLLEKEVRICFRF